MFFAALLFRNILCREFVYLTVGQPAVPAQHRPRFKDKGLSFAASAPETPKPENTDTFALGDSVKHKAFGSGVITKMSPMGGDYLIEINFEGIGVKKLMLRAAAKYMTKE